MGELMRRFVEEADRGQWTLLPECLDDFIDESNPVRVIDVFVDALDLAEMSFEGVEPAATGRLWLLGRLPPYHKTIADFRKDMARSLLLGPLPASLAGRVGARSVSLRVSGGLR